MKRVKHGCNFIEAWLKETKLTSVSRSEEETVVEEIGEAVSKVLKETDP